MVGMAASGATVLCNGVGDDYGDRITRQCPEVSSALVAETCWLGLYFARGLSLVALCMLTYAEASPSEQDTRQGFLRDR